MITGTVTARREALINFAILDSAGLPHVVEAVVDTGFDGWLTLPSALISALGLTWIQRGLALLSDGSESICDIYEASVHWDGQERPIHVDEAETFPLLGMALMEGYELTIQVVQDGQVTIRPMA